MCIGYSSHEFTTPNVYVDLSATLCGTWLACTEYKDHDG